MAFESVVANIELVKKTKMAKTIGQGSTEAIGVDVKESEVGEETKLFWQRARDVCMVQVNSGDRSDMRVIRGWSTIDPLVVADIKATPV